MGCGTSHAPSHPNIPPILTRLRMPIACIDKCEIITSPLIPLSASHAYPFHFHLIICARVLLSPFPYLSCLHFNPICAVSFLSFTVSVFIMFAFQSDLRCFILFFYSFGHPVSLHSVACTASSQAHVPIRSSGVHLRIRATVAALLRHVAVLVRCLR